MIKENVKKILAKLPSHVKLVAAAKTRTPEEVKQAVDAGIQIVGENYVQEAEKAIQGIGDLPCRQAGRDQGIAWHFIGHLQTNKVKKAVQLFDMIETVDSLKLAKEIDKQCAKINKTMPILIEINSGREEQKAGVYPEKAKELIDEISKFKNVEVKGLMTMGPLEGARPYFVETKKVFDQIGSLEILSMGMSGSYKVAIEEGANLVRIGTAIFGRRL